MFTRYDCLFCLLIHQELTLRDNCPYSHEGTSLEEYEAYVDNIRYVVDRIDQPRYTYDQHIGGA